MFHPDYPIEQTVQNFMFRIYGWMSLALSTTAITAYYVAACPGMYQKLMSTPGLLFGLFIAQIALVIGLSAFLHKMNLFTAIVVFMLYAVSVGITLSSLFYIYTAASLYSTFIVTAGMFGGMSLYGYFTRADLTSMGSMSIMALWGLILGMFVNMFLQSPMFNFVLSAIGVVVFTLLTAYDTQKLKQLGQQMLTDKETAGKFAVLGALTLYLDFLNLFLYMLRFMGRRREN